jgi:hypothetical protein
MTDLATRAATLLANFRTFHIPGSKRGHQPSGDWWARVRARQADNRAAYACRHQLCQELVGHGCRHFLHRMECDPAGGWRLHIFVADDAALTVLDQLTDGACGPGDPANFDPEKFVSARLPQVIANDTDDP